MMFTQHPQCNAVLAAPPGVPIEQCRALPIVRFQYEGGIHGVASFWRPSPDELAALNRGEPVRVEFQAHTHPAVYLAVGPLETEGG